ncbi:MAG: cytochrome-c peroxidase [Bacteroidetes bacterium]|nr:cytochrome-c peroxidase [Bacteroidota bacterium]
MKKFFIVILFGFYLIGACRKDPPPSTEPKLKQTPITLDIPRFFPEMIIPKDNKMTKERLALGRKLYYDPILSNNGRSCSSCHFQAEGFTSDPGLPTTVLPHVNLGWSKNFLWKGRNDQGLENVMLYEVEEFFQTDLKKINSDATYKKDFKDAFGVDEITSKEIAYSLAQFFRSLISGNSRYDQYLRNEISLTQEEMDGMEIFFTETGDCFHCHGSMLFTDNDFHNTGLDSVFNTDKGRYDVTGKTSDIGLYKTPTLRNASLRKRFMHDGRFTSLEQVIEFYNSGVHMNSPNIDPLMILPQKENGLMLSQEQKDNLLAFLKTLTDVSFTTNPNFSKP